MVAGSMQFLNGATTAPPTTAQSSLMNAASSSGPSALGTPSDGPWKLTPKKMTVTVTGVAFAEPGTDPNQVSTNMVSVSGCSATYDQTQPSLMKLSDCAIAAASGTYGSVTIAYSTTYQVLIDDPAGIYTDPTSSTGLTTARPSGGPQIIPVRDQNGGSATNYMTTYFASPVSVDKNNPPKLFVVFNPIHWVTTMVSGGVPAAPGMSGNPPITPAVSGFGKAEYYSNLGTIQAFDSGAFGCSGNSCTSFLVLYSDATTAQSVNQVDGNLQLCNGTNNSPNVAFNQNGLSWGTFGMLGRDSGGVLTWALPGPTTNNNTAISGYRGVMQMSEVAALGGSTTLSFQCTTSPPAPLAGAVNYGSGHPSLTPGGTISLTLLAH